LKKHHIRMPASGGVFDRPLYTSRLKSTIGGENDDNTFVTRRMLYLLEGEWAANRGGLEQLRELVARYVPDDLEPRKLTRFLLNDIIRYWRTICVDFEHKTSDSAKPRAIRLVKLRFSRMLLHNAGVATVRETVGKSADQIRETLVRLLSEPPLERLETIYVEERAVPLLASYATFLVRTR